MITMCRKNRDWKPIHISISLDEIETLGDKVGEEVRKNLTAKDKKKKWQAIDMVDTHIISTDSNPISGKATVHLLIYVADMTGKHVPE